MERIRTIDLDAPRGVTRYQARGLTAKKADKLRRELAAAKTKSNKAKLRAAAKKAGRK